MHDSLEQRIENAVKRLSPMHELKRNLFMSFIAFIALLYGGKYLLPTRSYEPRTVQHTQSADALDHLRNMVLQHPEVQKAIAECDYNGREVILGGGKEVYTIKVHSEDLGDGSYTLAEFMVAPSSYGPWQPFMFDMVKGHFISRCFDINCKDRYEITPRSYATLAALDKAEEILRNIIVHSSPFATALSSFNQGEKQIDSMAIFPGTSISFTRSSRFKDGIAALVVLDFDHNGRLDDTDSVYDLLTGEYYVVR